MPTLKSLLDDLEIDVSDLDDKGDEDNKDKVDLKTFKVDDLPEEHRPVFKQMMGMMEEQTNEIAKQGLQIKTMKDFVKTPEKIVKKDVETDDDEKVLGVLDKDDPYAPAFRKLAESIDGIKNANTVNAAEEFQNNLVTFAQNNRDIVRYATEMDKIVDKHPTMKGDIPTLYNMAKNLVEGRAKTEAEKKDELDRQRNLKNRSTERAGVSDSNLSNIVESKTIVEAFEAAEKSIAR